MKNFIQRLITGLILAAIAVFAINFGGVLFDLFILLIGALVLIEYEVMLRSNNSRSLSWLNYLLYVIFAISLLLNFKLRVIICVCSIFSIVIFLSLGKKIQPKKLFYFSFLGFPYIILSVYSLDLVRNLSAGAVWFTIHLFIIVWATDLGGYFFGKFIGGKKLLPAVSPSKTISGACGGILLTILLSVILWKMGKIPAFLLIVAPLISIISQIGDLLESGLKRSVGVKDSGKILPGHGGVFDRVDGLLLASIFYAVFVLSA